MLAKSLLFYIGLPKAVEATSARRLAISTEVELLVLHSGKGAEKSPMQFGRVIQLRLSLLGKDKAKPWVNQLAMNEVPVRPTT